MNHLPNPIFDQTWALLDVTMLVFFIAMVVWMTCIVMNLRQHTTRPDPTLQQVDQSTGEMR